MEREMILRNEINIRRRTAMQCEQWRQANPTTIVRMPWMLGKFFEENSAVRILACTESDLVRLDRHARRVINEEEVCGYDYQPWPCHDFLDLEYSYGLLEIPPKPQ